MERYTDKIVMITGAGDVALAIAERMLGEGAGLLSQIFPKRL